MAEDLTINDAVDSYVASLKQDEEKDKLQEGGKEAVDKEKVKDNNIIGLNNIARIIKRSIEMICLGEEVKVNTNTEDYRISVQGEDLGIAIGRDGRNMAALEYLVNLISKRKNFLDRRVTLDIKDYRKNKIEKITKTALKMAKKAIREGRKITLKPMCAYERKIIHNALSKFKDIKTRSKDEEPNRRIIIYPVKEAE
jgi:spoIIIJ-associated protein